MDTVPRVTRKGIVESLTLSRWLYPYSEQKICKVRKDSITTIMSASEGMKTFYRRQLDQGVKTELKVHDWDAKDLGEDFDEDEVRRYLESLEPSKSVKKKILH